MHSVNGSLIDEAASVAIDPSQPTEHLIGTPERLQVMQHRYEAGLPLFVDGDAMDTLTEPHADKQSVKHVLHRHRISDSRAEDRSDRLDVSEIARVMERGSIDGNI